MEECPNVEFPTVISVETTTEVVASGKGDLVITEQIVDGPDAPPTMGADEDSWSPSEPVEEEIVGGNESTWGPPITGADEGT